MWADVLRPQLAASHQQTSVGAVGHSAGTPARFNHHVDAVVPLHEAMTAARPKSVAAEVAEQHDLSIKERDQLRLHQLQLRKLQRAEQERSLLQFRHEQTVKRWEGGKQDVKPSKVMFLSDFLSSPAAVEAVVEHQRPRERNVVDATLSSARGKNAPRGKGAKQTPQSEGVNADAKNDAKQQLPKSSVARALLALAAGPPATPAAPAKKAVQVHDTKQNDANLLAVVSDVVGATFAVASHDRRNRKGAEHEAKQDDITRLRIQREGLATGGLPIASATGNNKTVAVTVVSSTKRRVLKQRAEAFTSAMQQQQSGQLDPKALLDMELLVRDLEALYAHRQQLLAASSANSDGNTSGDAEAAKEAKKTFWQLRRAKQRLSQMSAAKKHDDMTNSESHSSPAAPVTVEQSTSEIRDDDVIRDEEQIEYNGDNGTEELTAALTQPLLLSDADDVTDVATAPEKRAAGSLKRMRANFYPSLVQLGVGIHSLAPALDRRANGGGLVREYCVNLLTNELDVAAAALLGKLQIAQKKLKSEQPLHYRARMRFQCGLREVIRSIIAKKVRLVLVAPDVEAAAGEEERQPEHGAALPLASSSMAAVPATVAQTQVSRRGLEGTVRAIIDLCSERSIPWACCLSRQTMGRALRLGRSQVSVAAILSADGAYDEYRQVVSSLRLGLEGYQALIAAADAEATI